MAGYKHLTESECERIWFLHKKGMTATEIAFTIGRNANSIYRVLDIFTMCENGGYAEAEEKYGKQNHNLMRIARSIFGIQVAAAPAKTEPQPAAAPVSPDNTLHYLTAVLAELRRNNELLEKVCQAWGCLE